MVNVQEKVTIKLVTIGFQQFAKIIGQTKEQFKRTAGVMNQLATPFARFGARLRMGTSGLKGFRMEMLGVMFFGMAMQRMFLGLLRPAMEAFGVFDLWRVMLQVLFLPVMEMLFPIFMKMFEFFTSLSPEVQKVIGIFVLLGAIVGIALFIFGQFALGIGSILVLFIGFGPIAAVIGGVIAIVAGAFLIVIGIIKIFKGQWEGLGLVIMGIGVILFLFIGWWALIPIAIGAAVYLIIKHWDKIKTFFANLWGAVMKIWDTWWGKILLIVLTPFLGMAAKITENWDKIKSFFSTLWTAIKDTFVENWNSIKEYVLDPMIEKIKKIIDLAKNIGGKIAGFFGWGDGDGGDLPPPENDFIYRPGHKPVSFSPNDTIVGAKGGVGGTGAVINQTNNINISDSAEIERMIQDNNSRLVDDVKRITGATGG